MPEDNSDIAVRIMAFISTLPLHEQADAIHALISFVMKGMPTETIYEMRAEIIANFPDDIPIIRSSLEVIDGQLELRKIAGPQKWR